MSTNGESPGFKLFGKTIVSTEKDIMNIQEDVLGVVAAEAAGGPAGEESSSTSSSTTAAETTPTTKPKRAAPAHLSCPRCKSKETKFCYYNNYNVNQPRHFCKACHRYWTAGGVLRNVPVGAGRRKNRALPSSSASQEPGGGGGGADEEEEEEEGCGLVVGRHWRGSSGRDPAKSTFGNVDNYLIS